MRSNLLPARTFVSAFFHKPFILIAGALACL